MLDIQMPRRATASHDTLLSDMLHQRGYRATPQRQVVFDALGGRGAAHLTADAIYARVRRKSTGIDRATVYRTLYFLRDLGVVSQSEMNSQRVFELIGERPHHHLLCESCGSSETLEGEAVIAFEREVLRRSGFAIVTRHMVLTGLCANCRR